MSEKERRRKKAVEGLLLTELELKVIDLLSKYEGNVDKVAEELGVKPITVRMTKTRINKRLGRMLNTLKLAVEKGLVDPDQLLASAFPRSLYYALKGVAEEKYGERSVYKWLEKYLYEVVKKEL